MNTTLTYGEINSLTELTCLSSVARVGKSANSKSAECLITSKFLKVKVANFPSRAYFQLESDLLVLEWGRWAVASCCKPRAGLWKRRLLRRSSFFFMAARLLHSWTNLSTCRGTRHLTSYSISSRNRNRWSLHLQHKLIVWTLATL